MGRFILGRSSATKAETLKFTKARVQNGGAFYMEVPQMEGCNPDDVCVIRP